MERIKVASLFSGCGGMDLGVKGEFTFLGSKYKENRVEIVYAIDNDNLSAQIYNDNFDHKCTVKDIKEVSAECIPDHDLLIGGFPCKSFSIVAQNPPRLGYKGEQGKLFFEMVRILEEKKPRMFIAENVKGLLSANKKKAFPLIIKQFEKCGYYIKFKLLNAVNFGIPQKRERIFIVGFREYEDCLKFQFPDKVKKNAVLEDILDIKKEVNEKYYFSQKAVNGMLRNREKMNKGRVMDPKKPCNTITAHLAKVSLNSTDPVLYYGNKYRRFTTREAASIQSFPDDFKLNSVSERGQYVAIGNAVPPVLMWELMQSVILGLDTKWPIKEVLDE